MRSLVEKIMQDIQAAAPQTSVRRARADGELERLLENILSVGIVALDEDQAVEGYRAGADAMDKVLLRIAREANAVARAARRSR